jgi:hypothetical protein
MCIEERRGSGAVGEEDVVQLLFRVWRVLGGLGLGRAICCISDVSHLESQSLRLAKTTEETGQEHTGNSSEGRASGSSPVSQDTLGLPPLPPPRPPRPPPLPPRDIEGRALNVTALTLSKEMRSLSGQSGEISSRFEADCSCRACDTIRDRGLTKYGFLRGELSRF